MEIYEGIADRLGADGWIVGRRTMEEFSLAAEPARADAPRSRKDRIAERGARSLGIRTDRQGRLRPETGEIEGHDLVLIVSERVTETHVADVAARGVSLVFSGAEGDDFAGALCPIGQVFGVERLLLEGGGRINGAVLDQDLVDETSILVFPVIDDQRDGLPSTTAHG